MNVLVLSPYPEKIQPFLEEDTVTSSVDPIGVRDVENDDIWGIISFGYRHLISGDVLRAVGHRAVNLHASLLPWNRGADPNMWSWLENTPKGVSIHWITEGLDKGDLVAQLPLNLSGDSTLRQSYDELQAALVALFGRVWPAVRAGKAPHVPQIGPGSYHSLADRQSVIDSLVRGWDTTGQELSDYGKRRGLWRP